MKKILQTISYYKEKIFDNRIVTKLFLPISLINFISSILLIRKHKKILREVINENDKFFTALALLDFEPTWIGLKSIHEVDNTLSDDELYDIANKNFIATVKSFIVDEMLLGIVKIEVDRIKNNKIKMSINVASYRLFLADVFDLLISLLFTFTTLFIIMLLY